MLIGITGKAEAGKDTVGQILTERYGFHGTAFADPVRRTVQAKFGLSEWHVKSKEGKATYLPLWDKTVRELLQFEGTELGRDVYGNDIWIKRWLQAVKVLEDSGIENIVVNDVRFPEEAEAILGLGGYIVRVERPGHSPESLTAGEVEHRSEQGLSDKWVDTTLYNDGDFAHLQRAVMSAMATFLAEEERYGL